MLDTCTTQTTTPPAWRQANDRLSKTISEIILIMRQGNFDYEDAKAFYAPSECYYDIAKAMARAIKAALSRNGYTADDLIAEAESRTTARFVYDLGLSSILDWSE